MIQKHTPQMILISDQLHRCHPHTDHPDQKKLEWILIPPMMIRQDPGAGAGRLIHHLHEEDDGGFLMILDHHYKKGPDFRLEKGNVLLSEQRRK